MRVKIIGNIQGGWVKMIGKIQRGSGEPIKWLEKSKGAKYDSKIPGGRQKGQKLYWKNPFGLGEQPKRLELWFPVKSKRVSMRQGFQWD